MKTKLLMALLGIMLQLAAVSQTKLKFQTTVALGISEGEQTHALLLQAINGIRYRTWYGGIGTGFDYYGQRSIPLFLDVRKTVVDKPRSPFVYADGGYNFPWLTASKKAEYGGDVRTKGGWYYDAGLGYQMRNKKDVILAFSAGYSYKHFSTSVPYYFYCFWGTCPVTRQTFDYQLRRISIKAALSF